MTKTMQHDFSILETEQPVFNVLSLFSGAGFLDLGFMNQGFQIAEAIEIEPPFCDTYNYAINHYCQTTDNPYIKNGIVKHIAIEKPQSAADKELHKRLEQQYKGIDGIIGGPPCQDFSVAGKNAGVLGERGKLLQSYSKIVKLLKPKFIFFENVEGLLGKKHKAGFEYFLNELDEFGYEVWHTVLTPLEYGFAQDRPRIALIGFKKDIVQKLVEHGYELSKDNDMLKTSEKSDFVFKWPKVKYIDPKKLPWPTTNKFQVKKHAKLPNGLPEELTLKYAFKGITRNTPNQNEHFNSYSKKFWEREEGYTKAKSFKRLHRFRYSPAAAYGNNEVHLHPTEPRRLTVREALRIQTVPDEYVMPDFIPKSHKFKMIGNGVPTKKAELFALEIKKTLSLYNEVIKSQ